MREEKLLFVVHKGTVGGRLAGLIMSNHCIPIACSHVSWSKDKSRPTSADGFASLWEATADVEEFFTAICIGPGIEDPKGPGNGMWVYEVAYRDDEVSDEDDGEWPWLCGGELRRPTPEELEPLTRGEAPWGGVVF